MAKDDEISSASLLLPSEILSRTVRTILETVSAAEEVLVQKENFKKFSSYLERISLVLKEFFKFDIENSKSFKNAIDILNSEIKVAKELALECCKRSKIYLLLNCRRIIKELEGTTREIGSALGLIALASLDVSSDINDEISKLRHNMLDAEYKTAVSEDELMEKIESGIQERNVDRSYANDLLIHIAKALGISTERSELKKEFEVFVREMEIVELRKDVSDALVMERVIALLGKVDVTKTPEEKETRYINKCSALGSQPLEHLQSFYCPITGDIMVDPVETSSGSTFERSAIEKWLANGNSLCPLTMTPLKTSVLRSNKTLRQSIEEWNERNIMIAIASMKPKIQSNDEEEVLHTLAKLQDICMKRKLYCEWLIMEDYLTILIGLLGGKNSEIRKQVLVLICILATGSDNKEKIAEANDTIKLIVRSLARKVEESKLALQLLLELSRSNVVKKSIGSVQGCILLLVTMSRSEDTVAAKDAKELLESLSVIDQNIIQMARANYFGPLLHLLSSGSDATKMVMAQTLSEVELTDHNKVLLFEDGALPPVLLQMLTHEDIEMKKVAVKALQNLSNVPQNGQLMIREGALSPLFELLYRHSLAVPSLREQVAATIMNLAMSTTYQEAEDMQVSFLTSEEDIFKLFSLISLTGTDLQQSILQTFHALCQLPSGLKIRTTLRQLSAVPILAQLCELDNQSLRANAMKLFYCLTKGGDGSALLEHVGQKCIETVLRIIKTSDDVEETVAAMGVISNLPQDAEMNQLLLDAGVLQVIFDSLKNGVHSTASYKREVTENAAGALTRFTIATNQVLQKKVAEAGIIDVLVQLLVSGTAITKRNVAISLKQFSESSTDLSRPVKKWGILGGCFASPETGCPVHLHICTPESSFCLLEADAIKPLVGVLREPDIGACEASLDALLTLIDGEKLQTGSKVLAEANAIPPIIRLLSRSSAALQEKVLKALERIFGLVEFKKYGTSAQMPLVDITQRGSSAMKSLAAQVLAHLNVLHEQSSYF